MQSTCGFSGIVCGLPVDFWWPISTWLILGVLGAQNDGKEYLEDHISDSYSKFRGDKSRTLDPYSICNKLWVWQVNIIVLLVEHWSWDGLCMLANMHNSNI